MNIKILGSGCTKCKKLEENTRQVLKELSVDATVEKVTDFKDIMAYGVMTTPALVIDDKVMFTGKSPSAQELKKYF